MKLRALTHENVRKFGGKRVAIGAIGDGITVICEANEFGKSTFFDAIHAVVFEKHTATGKSVQSLRPRAGGGVRIGLEVEIDGDALRDREALPRAEGRECHRHWPAAPSSPGTARLKTGSAGMSEPRSMVRRGCSGSVRACWGWSRWTEPRRNASGWPKRGATC